jgi:carbohydrate-binding DOMON domain-containing protein
MASQSPSLVRRFFGTLGPAMLGAAAGYFYAQQTLSPEMFKTSALPGMYASVGAVAVVISMRVLSIVKALFFDRS